MKAVFDTLAGLSNDEANAVVVREVFGTVDARAALPGIQALSRQERFLSLLEAPLVELGSKTGIKGLRSAPRLSLVPESFEDPAATGSQSTRRFRDDGTPMAAEPLPDWWAGDRAPLVYVTFGSVAGGLGLFPDLYRDVVATLADLPVRVPLTLGDVGDPKAIGPLPPNVHIESWWPQQEVMPHVAAMIGHGGFGTTHTTPGGSMPVAPGSLSREARSRWANSPGHCGESLNEESFRE